MTQRVVVIGGHVSLMAFLNSPAIKKKEASVTVIQAHDYLEWQLASTYYLANPDKHGNFVSGDKSRFQNPAVSRYIYSPATVVDPGNKTVKCQNGEQVGYDVLIVSTGYKLPLFHPVPGTRFEERVAEIRKWGSAISKPGATVVVNGPGAIGIEMAGDARIANPTARVIMLSRSGVVAQGAPAQVQARVRRAFASMKIEVATATVAGVDGAEAYRGTEDVSQGNVPMLGPGKLTFKNGENSLAASWDGSFDVFLPTFAQGLNTEFLPPAVLDDTGAVKTNEFLQSSAHPEIFAIGVNTSGEGFIGPKLRAQAESVAKNALLTVHSKPLQKHVPMHPKLDFATRPMTIKIGNGPQSYLIWDNVPQKCPFQFCGFPFCLPTCAMAGCNPYGCFMCGVCCVWPEGGLAAKGFSAVAGTGGVKMLPDWLGGRHFSTFGSQNMAAPAQQNM